MLTAIITMIPEVLLYTKTVFRFWLISVWKAIPQKPFLPGATKSGQCSLPGIIFPNLIRMEMHTCNKPEVNMLPEMYLLILTVSVCQWILLLHMLHTEKSPDYPFITEISVFQKGTVSRCAMRPIIPERLPLHL